MMRDSDGVWELFLPGSHDGRSYAYRIDGPGESARLAGDMFDPAVLVADPYSKAVVTGNSRRARTRTLIIDTSYRWTSDKPALGADRNHLVIYEAHVRDLTAHPSASASPPGTYTAFSAPGARGGLRHLKSLGVNTVEFLPLMKFETIEHPVGDENARGENGFTNSRNPYSRNHWGYMTSFFFAPETYYGTDGTLSPGAFNGTDGRAVAELKRLIDTLHGEGLAVILDVVFNHTSEFDDNPLKYADRHYYYRTDESGRFTSESGCMNDFNTSRPMARRLIIDSILYWMREYHVDGFRFDLAAMIDAETCAGITAAARAHDPGVILIAEPWGGNYHHPPWFDELGWASWNDRYRDLVKGQNPFDARGFIFGEPGYARGGGGSPSPLATVLTGTLRTDGGLFSKTGHGINYLESHDGYTLGDFIRLGTGEVSPEGRYRPDDPRLRLSDSQLALNRFAALILLTSAGPVMIHEGQEFARSKVIEESPAPDPEAGKLDHNSYNKDNGTNHLDFDERDRNAGLVEYYRGLIGLRRRHPLLSGPRGSGTVEFPNGGGLFALCRIGPGTGHDDVTHTGSTGPDEFIVLLNADRQKDALYTVPGGRWRIFADAVTVYGEGKEPASGTTMKIPPSSGAIIGRNR